MSRPGSCPEHGNGSETERVFRDDHVDEVIHTYICDRCDIQWTDHLSVDHKEVDVRFNNDDA